jgi:hypothetical protein
MRFLCRRDGRTQPGVLTPGYQEKEAPPQRGGREFLPNDVSVDETTNGYLPPLQQPQPATRVQFGLGVVLEYFARPKFEDENDDEDSLADEACGPIITPAEKSASQARHAPKNGERSREDEALVRAHTP